jgi:hypothetical protein
LKLFTISHHEPIVLKGFQQFSSFEAEPSASRSEGFLPEAFGDELRNTGLAGPTRTSDKCCIRWLTVGQRPHHTGEMGNFGISIRPPVERSQP